MMYGSNTGSDETWKRIPQGSIGVEIGVWKGDSSAKFLKRAGHLHLVDPWAVEPYSDSEEYGGYMAYLKRYAKLVGSSDPADFQKHYDGIYQAVQKRFKDAQVTIHRCTSAEFFRTFKGRVYWAYVDGSHTFEGCLADLRGAREIVDQYIFGDDYGNRPQVKRAVDTFVAETGLQFEPFGLNQYQITC
jgi:hypothetical protein